MAAARECFSASVVDDSRAAFFFVKDLVFPAVSG